MTLNEEHFNEWLEALESRDYEQGTGCLATTDFGDLRYCCLGVGEKVAGIDFELDDQALPTPAFYDWLGLPLRKGLVREDMDETTELSVGLYFGDGEPLTYQGDVPNYLSVAQLNDGTGGQRQHSFAEIAAWLRENKDKLVAL